MKHGGMHECKICGERYHDALNAERCEKAGMPADSGIIIDGLYRFKGSKLTAKAQGVAIVNLRELPGCHSWEVVFDNVIRPGKTYMDGGNCATMDEIELVTKHNATR